MKVLLFGAGGREHALAWTIVRSPQVTELVVAPGNGGIAQWGKTCLIPVRCVLVEIKEDAASLRAMVALARAERPHLVVIGPEIPLALGLVDELERQGLRVFGPSKAAAMLETSKAFAKDFMQAHDIPTAGYSVCTSIADVAAALKNFTAPVVVKADGLAAGKGVVICNTKVEAEQAAAEMFSGVLLGAAVKQVVLEEFLVGEEISYFAVCDGTHAISLAAAQDHKRIGEGDTGPNTGGMGAYSTGTLVPDSLHTSLVHLGQQVVTGMKAAGTPFKGILFCGIMLVPQTDGTRKPMVLEFNTRFGDPETQALMLRLDTDIIDIFNASVDGTAHQLLILMKPGASVCVIAASEGYPGNYPSGRAISGLDRSFESSNVNIFHSGTAISEGKIVTAGGRVLGVAAYAADLQSALDLAYARLAEISFDGMQYRRDIGWRALM